MVFNIGKKGKENVFENILGRKKAFPDYKNNKLKKSKTGIFPKGLGYGFGRKLTIFHLFNTGKIGQ